MLSSPPCPRSWALSSCLYPVLVAAPPWLSGSTAAVLSGRCLVRSSMGPFSNFELSKIFDWRDPGSIPAQVRRKKIQFSGSRIPGSIPRHDRVRSLMSLACRLRSERPGFDSGFGSTAFRGIVRCRPRATETQRATPRNYTDGRDRRRREAVARAPHAWSRKCPGEPTLRCGDLSVVTGGASTHAGLSRGMGPEAQNAPWSPYQGRGRYPVHERGRVCLPWKGLWPAG